MRARGEAEDKIRENSKVIATLASTEQRRMASQEKAMSVRDVLGLVAMQGRKTHGIFDAVVTEWLEGHFTDSVTNVFDESAYLAAKAGMMQMDALLTLHKFQSFRGA